MHLLFLLLAYVPELAFPLSVRTHACTGLVHSIFRPQSIIFADCPFASASGPTALVVFSDLTGVSCPAVHIFDSLVRLWAVRTNVRAYRPARDLLCARTALLCGYVPSLMDVHKHTRANAGALRSLFLFLFLATTDLVFVTLFSANYYATSLRLRTFNSFPLDDFRPAHVSRYIVLVPLP